jgi:erythromycin esterase-like protein
LNDALSEADVVFLGETNHFVHEKSDFRLLFTRHLLGRGWSGFMEETGWSDGWRIERYLTAGDPHWLGRLSLFGHRGDSRTDRDDRPTGIFKASFEAYPHGPMRSEHERFYRGLRAAAGGRLSYFGVDIDGDPGGAYADIDALTSPWATLTEVAAWRTRLNRVPGESIEQEIRRLRRVRSILPASIEAEARLAVLAAMDALTDSLEYVLKTYSARTYEATRPGMAFREQAMKRRYTAARTSMGAAKPILMSHALHLAKNDFLIEGFGSVGPGGGTVRSLGHHIVQELGQKAFSIWMIYGSGEDSQPFADLSRVVDFPAETLNARLASFNEPTLFLLKNAPPELMDISVNIGQMYNSIFRTPMGRQVDALFYRPRVTPMELY